ncbi:MAG: permease prefix domain 1-containing protein [Limisphaerales bacterium]
MFDLDQAILEWRQQMAVGGIKMPDALDELESHLRDEVDQQVCLGLSQQEAFDTAAQRIGESKALKQEFRKVNRHRAWGFRNNPLALNLLTAWLFLAGWRYLLAVWLPRPYWYVYGILILSAAISVVVGVGLLRRNNIIRLCGMAWFALNITRALGDLAAHGLARSVYAYSPPIGASATLPHIIFGFLHVSYPVFYAVLLFNSAMNFFGLFLLTKPSIRRLFRPVSA